MRPRTRGIATLVVSVVLFMLIPAAAHACVIPRTMGVAFSIDDSGSMANSDPDLLRAAATGAGIDQLPDGSFVAASSFDSSTRSLVDPIAVDAANRQGLKDQVENGLAASGQTYYDLAFARAKSQLDAMPALDKKAVVFLSDGAPNGGDYDDELDAIKAMGVPVFAIGFADAPGSVLAAIAAETGGQAYTVQSPGEAQAVFARIISTLTCDAAQIRQDVRLQPNQTAEFAFQVRPSDREFRALATWLYGDVSVALRRPDKTHLVPGGERAGERFIAEDTYASVIGRNPDVGPWVLLVTASPDNADEVNVSIDVFRRTGPEPPDVFALNAPLNGARMRTGTQTFSWAGARNAESYELLIDDQVVQAGISRDVEQVTVPVPTVGQHTWRIAAVNQFGKTLSERRAFTAVTGYKYVALGDSFSAGEGVPDYFEPQNRCHRSKQAYPVFVQQPGVRNLRLYDLRTDPALGIRWGFQACSGATTHDVLRTRHHRDRFAQLSLDTTPDRWNGNRLPVDGSTSLVTIGIGGNDMKFSDVLEWCGVHSSHCHDEDYKDEGKSLSAYQRGLRDDTAKRLEEIYQRIRTQAPNARVLVLGYPHLVPETKDEQDCLRLKQQWITVRVGGAVIRRAVGLSHAEQQALRRWTAEFNQTIADQAAKAGLEYVPVDGYFAGHEPCGALRNDWINSLTIQRDGWKPKAADQSFHPNEKGHLSGYAQAVNDTLNPAPLPAVTYFAANRSVRAGSSGQIAHAGSQVTCPAGGPACTVMLEARARLGSARASAAASKVSVIARRTYLVKPGKSRATTFRLGRSARRALARHRRLRVSVTTTAYRGGWRTTQTQRVVLRAPARRSR